MSHLFSHPGYDNVSLSIIKSLHLPLHKVTDIAYEAGTGGPSDPNNLCKVTDIAYEAGTGDPSDPNNPCKVTDIAYDADTAGPK